MSRRFFNRRTGNGGRWSLVRAACPIAVIGISLFFFVGVPVPSHVRCSLIVEPQFPVPFYVPSNGQLAFISNEFETVVKGQTIARIKSVEIEQKLQHVQNNLDRDRNLLNQLRLRMNEEMLVAARMAVTQKNIEANEAELVVLQEDQSKLNVVSPLDGVVFPAPIRKSVFGDRSDLDRWKGDRWQGDRWHGHLTDRINLDCYVERGEQLFFVHSRNEKTVTLYVGEREIDFVNSGQPVVVLFSQLPGELWEGIVGEIYEVDVDLNQRSMGDIGMDTYQDSVGNLKSLETPYRVTVNMETVPEHAFVGSGGRARISIPSQTLAEKTWQFFDRLARFNL